MKYSKIIFFRYFPLTKKIFEDFYMAELSSIGISVEYWDLSSMFFKKFNDFETYNTEVICQTKFYSYHNLDKSIQKENLESTLFIPIVTYDGLVIRLFRLFSKRNCQIATFAKNMIPCQGIKPPLYIRIMHMSPHKFALYFMNKLALICKAINYIKTNDILFIAGSKGYLALGQSNFKALPSIKIININSDDYDRYLLLNNASPIVTGPYILFLDEYFPFHPDTILFGIKNINPEKYYADINSYFDRMEQLYGLPVIISAHPKALLYKQRNYYHGRQVFFGKTPILTKYASFVLAHNSTAISFSVIFRKKLHFITSHTIESIMISVHNDILNFSKYLKCNYQYIDDEIELPVIQKISEEAYQKYEYEFLTSSLSKNKLTKDILIDYFKNDVI